jgi:hypothetical protein
VVFRRNAYLEWQSSEGLLQQRVEVRRYNCSQIPRLASSASARWFAFGRSLSRIFRTPKYSCRQCVHDCVGKRFGGNLAERQAADRSYRLLVECRRGECEFMIASSNAPLKPFQSEDRMAPT